MNKRSNSDPTTREPDIVIQTLESPAVLIAREHERGKTHRTIAFCVTLCVLAIVGGILYLQATQPWWAAVLSMIVVIAAPAAKMLQSFARTKAQLTERVKLLESTIVDLNAECLFLRGKVEGLGGTVDPDGVHQALVQRSATDNTSKN